ncbi:MAG: CBS domain-containing protein [Gemmatimonadota bacterium]
MSNHMSQGNTSVRSETEVDQVMRLLAEHQVRRIPVVEDGDRLVGIIAQADLALNCRPGGAGKSRTRDREDLRTGRTATLKLPVTRNPTRASR